MSAAREASYPCTADEALARLVEGNERFVRGQARFPTVQKEILAELAKAQNPYATILGCSDSRVPPELKALAPAGTRRMSANLHANEGLLRKELKLPDFRNYAVDVAQAGKVLHENTKPMGEFLRDVMRANMTSFRVFGPDETASNRLQSIYEVSKKTWMADLLPEDADGGELARDGRVMEMLSEHTLLGWLEGYLLSGRHGFFHTYEAFAHVVDSMFNQHAKWLDICKNHVPWRASVASQKARMKNEIILNLSYAREHGTDRAEVANWAWPD